jgi:hypothetical protein
MNARNLKHPPSCNDAKKSMTDCPDRLDADRLAKLQERIAAAKIDRDIDELFRAIDQLDAGHDEEPGIKDFERKFTRNPEFSVAPVPMVIFPPPKPHQKVYLEGGGRASSLAVYETSTQS